MYEYVGGTEEDTGPSLDEDVAEAITDTGEADTVGTTVTAGREEKVVGARTATEDEGEADLVVNTVTTGREEEVDTGLRTLFKSVSS